MAWETIPGSGDLILGASDALSAQSGSFTNFVAQTSSLGVANVSSLYSASPHIIDIDQAAANAHWFSLRRSGAEKFRIGLDSDDEFTVFRGAGNTRHTTFDQDGFMRIEEVGTAPSSGDISSGGALYVQSGALHFMGVNGQVTVVATAG